MELQQRRPDLERAGLTVFAVSYDPVPILAAFAARHGIDYPLLSDEGSVVVRALGLLNTHLEEQAAHYGKTVEAHQRGVPYPGTFVLDERGVVAEKLFEQSYRVRPQAAALLADDRGAEDVQPGVRTSERRDGIAVTAWIAQRTYRPYQRLTLRLDLTLAAGLHVYGSPIPDGYTPLAVEIDALDALEVGPPQWPAPRPFRVAGLAESFVVHEGTVRATIPLLFLRNVGDVNLVIRARYQACSADECYPPDEVVLRLPLEGLDNIRD